MPYSRLARRHLDLAQGEPCLVLVLYEAGLRRIGLCFLEGLQGGGHVLALAGGGADAGNRHGRGQTDVAVLARGGLLRAIGCLSRLVHLPLRQQGLREVDPRQGGGIACATGAQDLFGLARQRLAIRGAAVGDGKRGEAELRLSRVDLVDRKSVV